MVMNRFKISGQTLSIVQLTGRRTGEIAMCRDAWRMIKNFMHHRQSI